MSCCDTLLHVMGSGKRLKPEEKAVIRALSKDSNSGHAIAKKVKRSPSAVNAYLRRLNGPAVRKSKAGRPPKLSERKKRLLLRDARNSGSAAGVLARRHKVPVSVRRVQQILQEDENLAYKKVARVPALTATHKKRRVEWSGVMAGKDANYWDHVIFSDEKRFVLDVPDGCEKYWADKRKPRRTKKRRQGGGGGVMVWGAISARGASRLVVVENTIDAVKYCGVLTDAFLPFIELKYGAEDDWCVFQQDGASAHTAKFTSEFMMDASITTMSWPAKSPDLNPIENVWAWICREVYEDSRQFDHVDDLTEAIQHAWGRLSTNKLRDLIRTMPRRLGSVLMAKGAATKY